MYSKSPKEREGQKNSLRNNGKDFLGRPVVKHRLPMLGTQVWPSSGKIPPAKWQLSPWAETTEPTRSRAWALQQEKPPQLESKPCSQQLEKARMPEWTSCAAKNK